MGIFENMQGPIVRPLDDRPTVVADRLAPRCWEYLTSFEAKPLDSTTVVALQDTIEHLQYLVEASALYHEFPAIAFLVLRMDDVDRYWRTSEGTDVEKVKTFIGHILYYAQLRLSGKTHQDIFPGEVYIPGFGALSFSLNTPEGVIEKGLGDESN